MGNNPVCYRDPDGRFQVTRDGRYLILSETYGNGQIKYLVKESADGIVYREANVILFANDGTKIKAYYKQDKSIAISENFDCHGYTFTNGVFWINNDSADSILNGDGYTKIYFPSAGDIMVQRDDNGNVVHSAKVIYFEPYTNSVCVKEAMGNTVFENGKKVRIYIYSIDRDRDSFYRVPENRTVDSIPKNTTEDFNEIWENL